MNPQKLSFHPSISPLFSSISLPQSLPPSSLPSVALPSLSSTVSKSPPKSPFTRLRKLSDFDLAASVLPLHSDVESRQCIDRIISIKLKTLCDTIRGLKCDTIRDLKCDTKCDPLLIKSIENTMYCSEILGWCIMQDHEKAIKRICKDYRNLLHQLEPNSKEQALFIANEYTISYQIEFDCREDENND